MINKLHPYAICAIIILIGVALLALVWQVQNKFIAIPAGLFGFLFIIVGLQMAANVAEATERQKHPEYDEPVVINTTAEKAMHYFGYAMGIGCLGAFQLAGPYFDNTVGSVPFVFVCACAGLVAAVIYYYTLKSVYPGFLKRNEDRQKSVFFTCLAIVAWTTAGIAVYNAKSITSIAIKKTVVIDVSSNARHGTPYLFVMINGKQERFSPARKEWEQFKDGDSVALEIGKGTLGYEYVFHFKPVR